MGWLSNLIGSADDDLLTTGELARGNITGVRATGMTLQVMNGLVERKCDLDVRVYRNGQAPYDCGRYSRAVSTIGPCGVRAMVCSACAAREPVRLRKVQPSSSV